MRIRWLGTAGFVLQTEKTTLLLDPYLTRAALTTVVASRLVPNLAAIRAALPARVDAVICGHSHFDHLLDAPDIARMTGARLMGSPSTCAFGAAHGLPPSQCLAVDADGATVQIGDCEVQFVPSLHARLLLGTVPFPGDVSKPPALPARAWRYRMGGAFGILVRTPDVTVYHNGSADLVDANLVGHDADVLLVGIAGSQSTPRYLERLLGLLRPRVVIPCHHDAFFAPLSEGVHLLPTIDLARFAAESNAFARRARVVLPLYEECMAVGPGAADVLTVD